MRPIHVIKQPYNFKSCLTAVMGMCTADDVFVYPNSEFSDTIQIIHSYVISFEWVLQFNETKMYIKSAATFFLYSMFYHCI